MKQIILNSEIRLKKLDPSNQKHIWLAHELDKDPLITGKDGYLWSIEQLLNDTRHLRSLDIYQSPYVIYCEKRPIGYLDLSHIYKWSGDVEIAYALLSTERGKGYATVALSGISKIVLEDQAKKVILLINPNNIKSQNVAIRSGFVSDGLTEEEHRKNEIITYMKTKKMLYQQQHRK